MIKQKFIIIFLSLILILGAGLRLWQVGAVPASPDWDEVALGYNAYSLMTTGRDEYGKFLPVVLQSFDDYKPALYTYAIIPMLPIFGLTVTAVRMPSVIFGMLTILAVYFLVKELLQREDIALISAFMLAISPWHIQFSRIGFEANGGVALNTLGALFFLKGLKKPWLLCLSAVLFGANLTMYQSDKVFTPLLVFALVLIYINHLFSLHKKYLIAAILVGCLVATPMVHYTLTNKNAMARAKGVSIFSQDTLLKTDAQRLLRDEKNHDFIGKIVDNRRIVFIRGIASGYLAHFDLNWLFIKGDISRHHAPGMGLLYLWELPFLLTGAYLLLFRPFPLQAKLFIFSWIFITPIPASITSGVPHAVRTLNFLPMLPILTAIGIWGVFSYIHAYKRKVNILKYIKYVLYAAFVIIILFFFSYFLNQYFVQQNYYSAVDWQYGYAQIIPDVLKIEKNYSKIIVSNEPPMDQSYMFFLFYLHYSPQKYLGERREKGGGFQEGHGFGKYEFHPFNQKQSKSSSTLYIGRPGDFPQSATILKTVLYPDGAEAMKMGEIK